MNSKSGVAKRQTACKSLSLRNLPKALHQVLPELVTLVLVAPVHELRDISTSCTKLLLILSHNFACSQSTIPNL